LGGLFTSGLENSIRTTVFIDGYNLYYGRLRNTPFKWLDIVALVRRIVRTQDGRFDVQYVHYFTAPAKEAFATHRKDSVIAQQSCHRALSAEYEAPLLQVTLGTHSYSKNGTWMPRYVEGQPCNKNDRVLVWKLEEKQTDVNLALAMYRACAQNTCDQVVVCSNDSDVEPVLKAIREDFPAIKIGVITPVAPTDKVRRFSASLAAQADWVRRTISDEELAASLLPNLVATKKKPVQKPGHW